MLCCVGQSCDAELSWSDFVELNPSGQTWRCSFVLVRVVMLNCPGQTWQCSVVLVRVVMLNCPGQTWQCSVVFVRVVMLDCPGQTWQCSVVFVRVVMLNCPGQTWQCFSFSFSSRWHRCARKGPYALRPVSRQSPLGCPRNSAGVCLVEHTSFPTSEGGMSAPSFLHSSLPQAIDAMMVRPVHVQKVLCCVSHILGTVM